MEDTESIKFPNGDSMPIPYGSSISYAKDSKVIKTPTGDVIKEFSDGNRVQMVTHQFGYEIQTEWFGKGIIRKAWDSEGFLHFRIATRMLNDDGCICSDIKTASTSIAHRTIYKDGKLSSIHYTLLGLKTLRTMNLEKRKGKVGLSCPDGSFEEITGFPKHKRLMSIRSVKDIENLVFSNQRE